jgi:HD-GYP domain-containing protein (c-di-GMP phosphodiesterase class II)
MAANTQTLITIIPRTIELGPIPFSLYASDRGKDIVLFCRAGFPITPRHKQLLDRSSRQFFVTNEEIDSYHDYAFERLRSIIHDPQIRIEEKAGVLRGIGRRIVRRLYEEPRSSAAMRHSGQYVENVIELVIESTFAVTSLFANVAHASYAITRSINVCSFCLLLGEILFGRERETLWHLGMGGLLLDIGMCEIEVNASGAQTMGSQDREALRAHVLRTEEIMREHGLPEEVLAMGRSHHERADGSGYPDGLRLADIHPFARVAAVADVYDSMTTDSGLGKPSTHLQALADMARNRHLYDPDVLRALLKTVLQKDELVEGFMSGGDRLKRILPS